MNTLTSAYIARAELWLLITTLAYFLLNGAQLFETAVLVPAWSAHPPQSLRLFQSPYRPDLKTFWIVLHSLHELTFILAILFCWQLNPVRNSLCILFAIHFAVRVWTLVYFAPNIMNFQAIADGAAATEQLAGKVSLWRTLNYIRVALFFALSIGLLPLCRQVMALR